MEAGIVRNLLLGCFTLIIISSKMSARSLRDARAVSYIANQTVCIVDKVIYHDGDPIPTDDACETCKCRPPGFACVLRECEIKPLCKAIRREGECCPEYQCGCEHNGKFFEDGDRIPNAESPCYSCYCQGSSITCALADCKFRFDCEPEYVHGECCPRYEHCPPEPTSSTTTVEPTTFFTTLLATNVTPETTLFPTTTTLASVTSSISSERDPIEDVLTTQVPTTSVSGPSVDSIEPETAFPVRGTAIEETSSEMISSSFENKDVIVNPEGSVTTTVIPEEVVTTLSPGIESPTTTSSGSESKELLVSGDEVPITMKPSDDSAVPDQNEISSPSEPTTVSPELMPEDYPTTQSWIPDTSLAAEHRTMDAKLSATTRNVSDSVSSRDAATTTSLPSSTSESSKVSVAEGVIQMEVTTVVSHEPPLDDDIISVV